VGAELVCQAPQLLAERIGSFVDFVETGDEPPALRRARVRGARRRHSGKLVVVTGAGSGIGRETVLAFAEAGADTIAVDIDRAAGRDPILHLRLFHPLNDYYGFSPIEAAAAGIDIHNAAGSWNKALLDNGARPSGALIYHGADGQANLSEEQFARLKSELGDNYQGTANAGRPLLLEGGLDWKEMSFNPKDMDFIQSKNISAREIAAAFGVPPMLLGITGDNTYANYQEANRAFYRQTVLPLAGKAARALSAWLGPRFGGDLRLWYDADQVEALSYDRELLWKRVRSADFLTVNEKRAALGYAPIAGGDALPENSD
jgi:HK97 family phage portal protein